MKITFFSNFLNHHQLPFCMEMHARLGNGFRFIATERVPQERLDMGYQDMSTLYPFSLNTYSSDEEYQRALQLGYESDVVITGSAPIIFIKKRLKYNKLTFHYSERIFKEGRHRIFSPKFTAKLMLAHHRFIGKKLYMLCASAYTTADFRFVGLYKNKTFKWGYFPQIKEHNLTELFIQRQQNIVPKLLWVGRFLEWKHPDDALRVASRLQAEGISFSMDIIGTGPMQSKLSGMIERFGLQDKVTLLGSMSPEEVRTHMERADVYLFTSDFNEGWGAVLNEAMNSACAVVASHAIGAVPFLLKNNENGLIYRNGDLEHLLQCVKELLEYEELRHRLGRAAYITMRDEWNPRVAAKRVIALSESLLGGIPVDYSDGPCSKAEVVTHRYNY